HPPRPAVVALHSSRAAHDEELLGIASADMAEAACSRCQGWPRPTGTQRPLNARWLALWHHAPIDPAHGPGRRGHRRVSAIGSAGASAVATDATQEPSSRPLAGSVPW